MILESVAKQGENSRSLRSMPAVFIVCSHIYMHELCETRAQEEVFLAAFKLIAYRTEEIGTRLVWGKTGLLIERMLSNPRAEDHLWEGCRGLAELAARDSDGLTAVRQRGGAQVSAHHSSFHLGL